MTTTPPFTPATPDDVQLVERSLQGDSAAFGGIVERYQSLICALTYSSCGNIHLSEDLAQETFIHAWRQLSGLREPRSLRSWLCGIARNVVNNFHRKQHRTPTAQAERWDESAEVFADGPSPADQAISQQEEAMLWRTLHALPETFREPMVLFYRQQESVAAVAEALDLSEDAVKQRLSRGRVLLTSQMERLMGDTLRKSGPAKVFTVGVMAALPLVAATSCTAGVGATAAKGAAAAKTTALMGLLNAIFGPLLGFVALWFNYKVHIESAQTAAQRSYIRQMYTAIVVLIVVFSGALLALVHESKDLTRFHPEWYSTLMIGLVALFAATQIVLMTWAYRRQRSLRLSEQADRTETPIRPVSYWVLPKYEYRSELCFLGLPLIHVRFGPPSGAKKKPVKAWLAAGDWAIGGLFAFGGIAIAPLSFGGLAVGLIPIGGMALGLLCWGGMGVGVWAIGGFALGKLAFGGVAIGWEASQGALALARDFAEGNAALARHANDAAARSFSEGQWFFLFAQFAMRYALLINLVWVIPMAMMWRRMRKSRQAV